MSSFTKRLPGGSKFVGEPFWMPTRLSPSASFPALNLGSADATLSATNWPLLVPFLYDNVKAEYDPFGTPVSAFTVSSWTISGSTVTLNFANNTANDTILTALHEEAFVHTGNTTVGSVYTAELGSLTGFRTVTLASSFAGTNPIPAGTYPITAIQAGSRVIKIDVSSVSPTPSGPSAAGTVEFFLHRIAGSTTTVRHFQQVGRGFMTPGDADGYFIAGLRTRGYFQGHFHSPDPSETAINLVTGTGGSFSGIYSGGVGGTYGPSTGRAITDGTNGTPLTRKITHGPASIIHIYQYGGVYNP